MNNNAHKVVALFLAAVISFAGCGGGGSSADSGNPGMGGGADPYPAKFLSWVPPSAYTDSTPLDPLRDLDVFEIYVKTSGNFFAGDSPMAAVQAVDPGSAQLVTTFNLANLGPYLYRGVTYFVTVRAVAKNGLNSDFSTSAAFSF